MAAEEELPLPRAVGNIVGRLPTHHPRVVEEAVWFMLTPLVVFCINVFLGTFALVKH